MSFEEEMARADWEAEQDAKAKYEYEQSCAAEAEASAMQQQQEEEQWVNRREVRFRAWNRKTKQMIPECFVDSTTEEIELTDRSRLPFIDVDYMQYAGLHDKNGKEIYEGDIVKTDPEVVIGQTNAARIYFENGCFFTTWIDSERDTKIALFEVVGDELEVIGNVYEK